MTDVADLVQEMRHLLWLIPHRGDLYRDVLVRLLVRLDWREPVTLRSLAHTLRNEQHRIGEDELSNALLCAAGLERLASEFEAGPPMPSVDDLIARYGGGEIGDRTVLLVMDWDHWQLFEACAARELPPIQIVPDASPGTVPALREHLRGLRDGNADEDDADGDEE